MIRNIDFIRGELVGAARALLAIHVLYTAGFKTEAESDIVDAIFDDRVVELQRLVNNEFQFHGNPLGDPVQFALTILLMVGEEHCASGRHKGARS